MKTMYQSVATPEGIAEAIAGLEAGGAQSIGIFACANAGLEPANIDSILKDADARLFGGIFPQILYQDRRCDQGVVLLALNDYVDICTLENISAAGMDYEAIVDRQCDIPVDATSFVFVDGYARHITDFVDALFNCFGLDSNYLGGGAGALTFESQPCIITNQGLLADAAQIVVTRLHSSVGVRHGWEFHRGPLRITEVSANVVHTIDWRPAFEVYTEIIGQPGIPITPENFFEQASSFPFGIKKIGAEYLVRDPVAVQPDGSIIFVGDMPQDGLVDILFGRPVDLIAAAREAVDLAREGLAAPDQLFFVDCISRVLFLGDAFDAELDATGAGNRFGIFSIGEIANSGRDYLDFYNKTAVAGLLKAS